MDGTLSGSALVSAQVVVAAAPSPSPTQLPFDPSRVEPGIIGLAFFLVLAVAVVLLVFSMRRHLGRIDVDRREDRPPSGPDDPGRPRPDQL